MPKLDSIVALLESQLIKSHAKLQHLQDKIEVAETKTTELVKHNSELTTELLQNKEHANEVEKLSKAMSTLSLQHEQLTKELSSYKDCKIMTPAYNFIPDLVPTKCLLPFSTPFNPTSLITWSILVEIVLFPQVKKEAHQEL